MLYCGQCQRHISAEEAELGKKDVIYSGKNVEIVIECPECGVDVSIYTKA